jgi:hypothetical protein
VHTAWPRTIVLWHDLACPHASHSLKDCTGVPEASGRRRPRADGQVERLETPTRVPEGEHIDTTIKTDRIEGGRTLKRDEKRAG